MKRGIHYVVRLGQIEHGIGRDDIQRVTHGVTHPQRLRLLDKARDQIRRQIQAFGAHGGFVARAGDDHHLTRAGGIQRQQVTAQQRLPHEALQRLVAQRAQARAFAPRQNDRGQYHRHLPFGPNFAPPL